MCEKSHQLNQPDSAHETCHHANQSFKKNKLPAPIFGSKWEEGEAEIAEHKRFQGVTDYLKSTRRKVFPLGR